MTQKNHSDVTIRLLELEDLPQVYALGEKLYTADKFTNLYRFWDEYEVVELFDTDGDTCIVAEQDGKVVGFALGMLIDKRNSAWVYGYLVWLGVAPGLGRKGLGTRLLHHLTNLFIEEGARMVFVDTAADNQQAISFFKKNGFGNPQAHVFFSMNLTHHPAYTRRKKALRARKKPST